MLPGLCIYVRMQTVCQTLAPTQQGLLNFLVSLLPCNACDASSPSAHGNPAATASFSQGTVTAATHLLSWSIAWLGSQTFTEGTSLSRMPHCFTHMERPYSPCPAFQTQLCSGMQTVNNFLTVTKNVVLRHADCEQLPERYNKRKDSKVCIPCQSSTTLPCAATGLPLLAWAAWPLAPPWCHQARPHPPLRVPTSQLGTTTAAGCVTIHPEHIMCSH